MSIDNPSQTEKVAFMAALDRLKMGVALAERGFSFDAALSAGLKDAIGEWDERVHGVDGNATVV